MPQLILLVDDDESVLTSLSLLFKQHGYRSCSATGPKEAMDFLRQQKFDLVLQDMNFSRQTTGEEGLKLLHDIKQHFPELPIILMTAWGSIALAVKGVQAGAADFITKPWMNESLIQSVQTVLGLTTLKAPEKLPSREELDARYDFKPIIGRDNKLLKILELIGRIAKTDASVLITGESGTGKELIADAIHKNSPRKNHSCVKVNLGAVPPQLFESELFGHVKGAFTDAKQDRKGRFELAHQGTIFLDEIGDLDFSCQVKLLRVLQDKTFEAVGSSKTQHANVRVVSATNRDLSALISRGAFREDLLYRLNLIAIHLPPLRERKQDIRLLADYFLTAAAKSYKREIMTISSGGFRWLESRTWPGNIRQLRHVIERTVLIAEQTMITEKDFELSIAMQEERQGKTMLPAIGSMTLDELEKAMIQKAMTHYEGNISRIADALGLSRAALYRRCEKFGINYQEHT
jgi:two-component system, NtrC family, response regulator